MSKKNNPNGANQWRPDPRQSLFLQYYLDPKSETFSNALQSALKAGYEQEYAESILSKGLDWLAESVGDNQMLYKAEKNLKEFLEMTTLQPVIGAFGPVIDKKTKQPVIKENSHLLKIKADISKFVTERLNKKKWAQRTELTGREGQPIVVESIDYGKLNKDKKPI